jgi:1,4-dihydroxy-2-naphthoate octaprenyltransferase
MLMDLLQEIKEIVLKSLQHESEKYEDFDPELKKVALSTFALSILFWLTLYLNI